MGGYAFGTKPTSLDAAIYGFIANIYFLPIATPLKQFVDFHIPIWSDIVWPFIKRLDADRLAEQAAHSCSAKKVTGISTCEVRSNAGSCRISALRTRLD